MDVSIIIPCYNQGCFLDEAIESIEAISTPYSYEVIIVDDGSTDEPTVEKFAELEAKGYRVQHKRNGGLADARNAGLALASGKFIIPLDADNKLHYNYLCTAIDVLVKNPNIDVVYGDAIFFGATEKIKKVGRFNVTKLIKCNYIDACAVIRKSTLDKAGGYDKNMPGMGNEDWDLWVNIFFQKGKFYYLSQPCFYYRVTDQSMKLNVTQHHFELNKQYILAKYASHFASFFCRNYNLVSQARQKRFKTAVDLMLGRINLDA